MLPLLMVLLRYGVVSCGVESSSLRLCLVGGTEKMKDGESWRDEEYKGWRGLGKSFVLFDRREGELKG
ncbi:hypothetical protein TIFTF001_026869 [Ficus carica]|uniref:Secreted protein n=1 Tax=Ficus carica TaxID=3494 RepID=A0AA88DLY2_FICCA|nr:hypothetical protein TIFTF001_026869 [Ficus carica]